MKERGKSGVRECGDTLSIRRGERREEGEGRERRRKRESLDNWGLHWH